MNIAQGPCDAGTIACTRAAPAKHGGGVIAATVLGSSMAFIDGSVVNVALPAIGQALRADAEGLQWVVNAYLLPLGALVLVGGAAGDRFGRRAVFNLGLISFALASVGCALAPTLNTLLLARLVQGIAAAMLVPSSLALLGAAFTGAARGRAIGAWAAAGAIAGAVGPVLGGWLVDTLSWRAIFLINVPIAAVALLLARAYVEESRDPGSSSLDAPGAALATIGLGALTWGLTIAPERGWAQTSTIAALVAGVSILAGFVAIENRRGARAMMPLTLFASRTFSGVSLLTLFLYAAMGGMLFLLPFLLIRVDGFSATAAGAALLPFPIVLGVLSPAMGRLNDRIGARVMLTVGPLVAAIGLALFARVSHGAADYWTVLLPALLVLAFGMAVSVAPLTTTVMNAVDDRHAGTASGVNNAVARVAGVLAVALLGGVLAASDPRDFVDGFRVAALVCSALAVAAAASGYLLIERQRRG